MLSKRKSLDQIWQLFERMLRNKVYPNTGKERLYMNANFLVTFEIMANALYNVPKLGSKAYELFEEQLTKRRIKPNEDFILKQAQVYSLEGNKYLRFEY